MHAHKIKDINFSEECTKIVYLTSRFDVKQNVKGKAMAKRMNAVVPLTET